MDIDKRPPKILFVCTKPFQYMIARLIKLGCGFERCDIVVLNHFYGAADFCRKVRETRAWEQVIYIDDDGTRDRYKLGLGPIRKYFFYHRWGQSLPSLFANISDYSEAFIAHDFVAIEYAIMRKFDSEGKRVRLYEEGFGNYIDNSTHTRWYMKLLKRMAPKLGLPGGVFGSVKWIESIWLQRPQLFVTDGSRSLKNKARPLPMTLKEFLRTPQIAEELYWIYPELREIDRQVAGRDEMTVVLTEPFIDNIEKRQEYLDEILRRVNDTLRDRDPSEPVFFKQHPGELSPLESFSGQVSLLPKGWPIELLYLVVLKHDIRKLNLFSFGSTAILNLYDLCRNDGNLDIFIFESMTMREEVKMIASRFCELAERYEIRFQSL